MKPPRIVAVAVALLTLALGLAACGEKSEDTSGEAQPFSLTLDFYPNPDHAGIYMAQQLGYFREAGLNVSITTPSDPSAPLKLLVVAIGALVNRPLTSMIWLKKSGVKGVGDLRGKTIATAGISYQEAFLKTILARVHLSPSDVKSVNVGFGLIPALVGGSAQAMLGGYSNVEGIDLRERGKGPVVTPVDKLGVPTYDELVLVANRRRLEEDPEKFRLFIAALERGTNAAVKQPKAATQAVLAANHDLEPKLTAAEVKATLPLLAARTPGQPYAYMDPAAWRTFAGWMRDNGLISSLPEPSELLSNDYLPRAIPE